MLRCSGGEEYLQILALGKSPWDGGGSQQAMEHNWFHLGIQARLLSRKIPEDGQELTLQPSLLRVFKPGGSPSSFSFQTADINIPTPAGALLCLPTWILQKKAVGVQPPCCPFSTPLSLVMMGVILMGVHIKDPH